MKIALPHYLAAKKPLFRWAAWFCGGVIPLFWLIGLHYFTAVSPTANLLSAVLLWLFLGSAFLGQLALIAFVPCFFIILLFVLLTNNRALIFTVAVFTASFATLILYIDTVVFAQFHFHLNTAVFNLFFNKYNSEVFDITRLEWALLAISFAGLLALYTAYGVWLWKKLKSDSTKKYGKNVCLGLIGCLLFSYYLFIYAGIYPALSFIQQVYTIPLYDEVLFKLVPIKDIARTILSVGQSNYLQPKLSEQQLHYPLHPLQCSRQQPPLNLVIIVIDTWRFDMLKAAVMPNLTQFAHSSWQFTNHFSGGNGTQPGIFSLFYGLPSQYWTATVEQHTSPALIDQLLKQEYQMGVFASAELSVPAFNKNVFVHVPDLQINTPGNSPYERDNAITVEFQHFLQRVSPAKPFFSFLFYDSAHSYCAPGNPIARFAPVINVCDRLLLSHHTDPLPYLNRYQNALFYMDSLIAKDLNALKAHNLLNNTVIIITGDHGNEFNDNHQNYWGHASNFTHYQVQTPLTIYWPGKPAGVFNQQTSHYDIAPTLLTQLLGCQNPPIDYSIGSIIPSNQPPPPYLLVSSYIDFAIYEKDRITTIYPTGSYEIDDLNNRVIPDAKLRTNILELALTDMKKYFK